jgi:hypothetical protein
VNRFAVPAVHRRGGPTATPSETGSGCSAVSGGSAGKRPPDAEERSGSRACLIGWLIVIGLGAQILALAAGGRRPAGSSSRCRPRGGGASALNGYLPEDYPLAVYMRDRPVPPGHAAVLAEDASGRPALWQLGRNAFGFAGHPGLKVAMVEDLIMEFEEAPGDVGPGLERLRAAQRALEDALVPIMTGLVQLTGWTHSLASA